MGESRYFEVRCERCSASFAPGTKRCVHCGGPLGRRTLGFDTPSGARGGGMPPVELEVGPADAQPSLGRILRLALVALAALAAIARIFIHDQ